ncbi:hypothetical protein Tsubulata_017547 [Turnera subulata]|uniref:SMC hinge domain-containing protein n=1 Tax=Turnera subulata TaxID=218843 RepID=A0A9Q0F5V8_9ROSI|nr:hypothetical protein Tsubulata_017547 [Turnera subulata]
MASAVGANGHMFVAIRFVLSDMFQNLCSEDRHKLLHEGAGHQVLSAFVEIVFDNSDNRIPVDKEEVRLRRAVSLKKMIIIWMGSISREFYVHSGKKTEVMNLLDSAGFSRSNPYYVVQQGKIASLTLMKDSERLDLLKEIGGIRFEEARKRISDVGVSKRIMENEKKLSILYQKQGQATQFSSKAASDKWLQEEIDNLQRVLSSNLAQEKKLQDEIHKLKADVQEQDRYVDSCRAEIANIKSLIIHSREGFNYWRAQRDKLHDERKSLWGKEISLNSEIDKLRTELEKAEKCLGNATPGLSNCSLAHLNVNPDVKRGLNSIQRFYRNDKNNGVSGPLIELFDCDEKFFTAVEVAAGNSLFHVVVENDDISTSIIRHLNSLEGGRVTFIPLNRVKAPHVTYPQSLDVIPLLKMLKFDSKFNPAFVQVFARTVICRDLDVATRVARTYGLDCITLEGDQVNKKGGMTGGFYDHRRSKLKLMAISKQSAGAIKLKEEELETLIDAKRALNKSKLEQLKQDIANANKLREALLKAIQSKEKSVADASNQIDQVRASVAMKVAEMGTEVIDHLTPEEKGVLSQLNPEIGRDKEDLIKVRADRFEAESRKAELETNFTTNLKRQQELEAIISSEESDMLPCEAKLKSQELRDAKSLVETTLRQLKSVMDTVEKRSRELESIKDERIKLQDGDHGDDDGPGEADVEGRVEKYIGVKLKVSFTGGVETQLMKQLSGGQKTVVALALIFAIQRCDPAPF